jgi:hypothetical protein
MHRVRGNVRLFGLALILHHHGMHASCSVVLVHFEHTEPDAFAKFVRLLENFQAMTSDFKIESACHSIENFARGVCSHAGRKRKT